MVLSRKFAAPRVYRSPRRCLKEVDLDLEHKGFAWPSQKKHKVSPGVSSRDILQDLLRISKQRVVLQGQVGSSHASFFHPFSPLHIDLSNIS